MTGAMIFGIVWLYRPAPRKVALGILSDLMSSLKWCIISCSVYASGRLRVSLQISSGGIVSKSSLSQESSMTASIFLISSSE